MSSSPPPDGADALASGGTVPGSLGSAGAAEGPLLLGAAGAAVDVALAVVAELGAALIEERDGLEREDGAMPIRGAA